MPKTRNAKVMRRVILSAYLGEDTGDFSALENPNTVEKIKKVSVKSKLNQLFGIFVNNPKIQTFGEFAVEINFHFIIAFCPNGFW